MTGRTVVGLPGSRLHVVDILDKDVGGVLHVRGGTSQYSLTVLHSIKVRSPNRNRNLKAQNFRHSVLVSPKSVWGEGLTQITQSRSGVHSLTPTRRFSPPETFVSA
jgi:hypothetical protein